MMRLGGTFDENEYSRSGLEHRTSDGIRIRRENKSAAVNAVLDEQDRQVAGNFLDEQELANIYTDCVYSSQVIA
jgi:beta-lactamase class A